MKNGDRAKVSKGLIDAFLFFCREVHLNLNTKMSQDLWDTPCFHYLLTKKQFNDLKKICLSEGMIVPEIKAIPITRGMIKHVITQRKKKDSLGWEDCARILSTAYSDRSNVYFNKKHDQQGVVLNQHERIEVSTGGSFYATAIIDLDSGEISPITAYHANEKKRNKIKGDT